MQGSLYLNSLPVQSDPLKLRGRTSYVHKRVWSCASLPGPPANLRTRPTLSTVRNAEQLYANQLQRRGSPTAHNEQRKHHCADGNAQEQSKMISKLMPTAAVLLSTAALICWSLPANADASVQAIEQVAQQLTSDSSGSLSECALALVPGPSCIYLYCNCTQDVCHCRLARRHCVQGRACLRVFTDSVFRAR